METLPTVILYAGCQNQNQLAPLMGLTHFDLTEQNISSPKTQKAYQDFTKKNRPFLDSRLMLGKDGKLFMPKMKINYSNARITGLMHGHLSSADFANAMGVTPNTFFEFIKKPSPKSSVVIDSYDQYKQTHPLLSRFRSKSPESPRQDLLSPLFKPPKAGAQGEPGPAKPEDGLPDSLVGKENRKKVGFRYGCLTDVQLAQKLKVAPNIFNSSVKVVERAFTELRTRERPVNKELTEEERASAVRIPLTAGNLEQQAIWYECKTIGDLSTRITGSEHVLKNFRQSNKPANEYRLRTGETLDELHASFHEDTRPKYGPRVPASQPAMEPAAPILPGYASGPVPFDPYSAAPLSQGGMGMPPTHLQAQAGPPPSGFGAHAFAASVPYYPPHQGFQQDGFFAAPPSSGLGGFPAAQPPSVFLSQGEGLGNRVPASQPAVELAAPSLLGYANDPVPFDPYSAAHLSQGGMGMPPTHPQAQAGPPPSGFGAPMPYYTPHQGFQGVQQDMSFAALPSSELGGFPAAQPPSVFLSQGSLGKRRHGQAFTGEESEQGPSSRYGAGNFKPRFPPS